MHVTRGGKAAAREWGLCSVQDPVRKCDLPVQHGREGQRTSCLKAMKHDG